jgi:hypothetical protein
MQYCETMRNESLLIQTETEEQRRRHMSHTLGVHSHRYILYIIHKSKRLFVSVLSSDSMGYNCLYIAVTAFGSLYFIGSLRRSADGCKLAVLLNIPSIYFFSLYDAYANTVYYQYE